MDKTLLHNEYGNVLTKAEEIRQKYNGKSGGMSATDAQEFEGLMDRADNLRDQITLLEREEKAQAWGREVVSETLPRVIAEAEAKGDKNLAIATKAFNRFLLGDRINDEELKAISQSVTRKAYQADNPAGGGFLVVPEVLVSQILETMRNYTYVRGLATVFPLPTAGSLGVPSLDTEFADFTWTSELATGSEETTGAFGKRELRPNPLAKSLKLSKKLVRQVPNSSAFILDRLAYVMGTTQENAFLTGSGANQPLGVFTVGTAATGGISTSRDKTTASATAITADELIDTYFLLKAQYRSRAKWILHRDVIKAVRKLKDSNNNYLWATGMGPGMAVQGVSQTLMGVPLLESEFAPGTIATGLYTAIIGDFSQYWIADALDMEIQVVDQLYAATNQNGYFFRAECDGMPVLEEAFARLKQA